MRKRTRIDRPSVFYTLQALLALILPQAVAKGFLSTHTPM